MDSKSHSAGYYFLSLEIENVRCFGQRQTLDLRDKGGKPAMWTLILGNNGVGKTTLLQSLVWMRPVLKGKEKNDKEELTEPALDSEENETINSLFRVGEDVTLALKEELYRIDVPEDNDNSRTFTTESVIQGKNGKIDADPISRGFPLPPGTTVENFRDITILTYGAARLMGNSNLRNPELLDPLSSVFTGRTELYDASEILRDLDHAKEKGDAKAGERLEIIKEVLADILPDVLAGPESIEIHVPEIAGSPDKKSGVHICTAYGSVPMSGLSLGYQTVAAWIVDMALRLMGFYPESSNPLTEPAVVLIDEIDLHLHPSWQRTIKDYLIKHFPRTQFIATAHSPLMVQASLDENLVVLKREDDHVVINNQPEVVKDWRVDQILTSEVYGFVSARNKKIEELIIRKNELLDILNRSPEAERELDDIVKTLDALPTADSYEDHRAMEIIRQAADLIERSATE